MDFVLMFPILILIYLSTSTYISNLPLPTNIYIRDVRNNMAQSAL